MFNIGRFTLLRHAIVAFTIFVITLPGCDVPTPTPTPPPTLSPFSANLVVNPNSRDVFTEQTVALTVEASGQNLRFEWSAARGTLSASNTPSVIYTAPNTPGVDIVTVEVTSDSGATTKNVSFDVQVRPTSTPTPTIRITMPITRVLCPLNDPCAFAVTGTSFGVASDPSLKAVVFVNPDPGQSFMWWPHPSTSIQGDGTWQGQARIGYTPCWPIGDDFQIVAMVMTIEQANKLTTDFQLLPQEYVARSDVVDLVTAYAPVEVDLSRASASSDDGSSVTISATETSLEINYDLGTGGWVLVTVRGNLDLSCMEKQGASIAFSLEGTGAANSFEVKVEDTDGTNYGWLSEPGESVTPNKPLRLPLDSLKHWWGGTDATMNWQQVKNIMFAVSKKSGDEGGKGQVIVKDVVITP
jgi:hypothetical protein